MRKAGDFKGLEKLYVRALTRARAEKNLRAQIGYLTALGNTYVFLFRYTDAIAAYAEARDLAHANSDWLSEGAVAPGLSSVYLQVGDWAAARESAQAGLIAAQRLSSPPYYEAQLKLQHARLNAGADETPTELLQAIEVSRKQTGSVAERRMALELEAEGWDLLGEEGLRRRDLTGAEHALEQAFKIRSLQLGQDLRLSYWRLGALRLAQNRLAEAQNFTKLAIAQIPKEGSAVSRRNLLLQRGLIAQAGGDLDAALRDFESAARSAEHWRQVVPPLSRSSLASADTEADRKVFGTFIEAAARKALTSGDLNWARKALLATERNRATSLNQSAALAEVWRRKLPPKYWQTLAQLRTEESRQVQADGLKLGENPQIESLHLALTEMEATAGLGYLPNNLENFSSLRSLTLFQKGLKESELFLSFHLGIADSYLWAVTRGSLHLYRLPAADRIEDIVRRFKQSVIQHQAESDRLGQQAYTAFFGQLDAREASRHSWILSLDGSLFDLPVAATRDASGYLVESHSIQITPSATWLGKANSQAGTGRIGVGDPIYNWADERLPGQLKQNLSYTTPGQLNRLVASGEELRSVAQVWGAQGTLLQGETASRASFLQAVTSAPPAHVYLATHVIANTSRDRAFLAFSLSRQGGPELLGTTDIAMLKVPGALVVMNGCASGTGVASPGAGLIGLTRAWLSAGAQGVLATAWPMEDSRGDLIPAFYRNLSTTNGVATAEALRRGQVAMIHSKTWQADPAYWAAFQLTGGVR